MSDDVSTNVNQLDNEKSILSSLASKVLTREEDIKMIQPYLDKLRDTVNDDNIFNIALSGSYGSGKSTIINTFLNIYYKHQKDKYLRVSLASFNNKAKDIDKDGDNDPTDKNNDSDENNKKEELERLLEISILQQIFYHVEPSKIPQSRFRRIVNVPWYKLLLNSLGFVLWIVSLIFLFRFKLIDKISPNAWNSSYDFDWGATLSFLIALLGLGIFAKTAIELLSNAKITRVSIKGEIELGENINKSAFNEHLEEILYFFESTDYKVVIIEDLDRFDNTNIFNP